MLTDTAKASTPVRQYSEIPDDLRKKMTRVLDEVASYGSVLVAFSGGIDSTLMAMLAKMALEDRAVAVTAESPSLPTSELTEARRLAKEIGIRHLVVATNELQDSNYVSNPANRCYFCKKELGAKLTELALQLGGYTVVDGTNAEDLKGHRPGAAALIEKGVRRPLADAGFTKDEVRSLARYLGLSNYDKPSMPCLSSRVAYGEVITPERLLRIERAEETVRSLTGVRELRVRDHGTVARIEVGRNERKFFFNEELMDHVSKSLRKLGFVHVTLDMAGYRSGSMNETSLAIESSAHDGGSGNTA